jgi:hypothetical protein
VTQGSAASVVGPQAIPPVHTTYSALVDAPNDLVGLIAYSIYKREKLDFVEAQFAKHGRVLTPAELQVFYQLVNMPAQVAALRTRSATLLEQVSEEVLSDVVEQLENDYKVKLTAELKVHKNFWRSVGENVLANLFAAGLIALSVLLLFVSRVDVVPMLGKAFGYEVIATPAK